MVAHLLLPLRPILPILRLRRLRRGLLRPQVCAHQRQDQVDVRQVMEAYLREDFCSGPFSTSKMSAREL